MEVTGKSKCEELQVCVLCRVWTVGNANRDKKLDAVREEWEVGKGKVVYVFGISGREMALVGA